MNRLAALAKPRPTDARFERLARLAVGRLAGDGRTVSRSTLAAMSAVVDDDPPGRKRGFCEATIDNNAKVRAVFDRARRIQTQGARRRRGAIAPQIRRLNAWDSAQKLMLARDATTEREVGLDDLLARTGADLPDEIASVRLRRAALPANRTGGGSVRGVAAVQRDTGAANRFRYSNAVEALQREKAGLTVAEVAARAKLHPSTVARLAREASELVNAKRAGRPAVVPPNRLLRVGKRELHRALDLERRYNRAIDRAVAAMAKVVVEGEIEAMRAARLGAEAALQSA
jgi:hypothetical protein